MVYDHKMLSLGSGLSKCMLLSFLLMIMCAWSNCRLSKELVLIINVKIILVQSANITYLKRKLVRRKMNSLPVLVLLRVIYKPKTIKIVSLILKHIPHGKLNKVNGNGLLKEFVFQIYRNLMQHLKLLYSFSYLSNNPVNL